MYACVQIKNIDERLNNGKCFMRSRFHTAIPCVSVYTHKRDHIHNCMLHSMHTQVVSRRADNRAAHGLLRSKSGSRICDAGGKGKKMGRHLYLVFHNYWIYALPNACNIPRLVVLSLAILIWPPPPPPPTLPLTREPKPSHRFPNVFPCDGREEAL